MINIPNIFTFYRIISVPFLIVFLYIDSSFFRSIAVLLFILAGLTDFLDGYIARKRDIETSLGKLLDPIADKLLIVSTLIAIVNLNEVQGIHVIACYIIILREIFISGLREYAMQFNLYVPVSFLAKVKTMVQMFSILFILNGTFPSDVSFIIYEIGILLLWLATIITLITSYSYFKYVIRNILSK